MIYDAAIVGSGPAGLSAAAVLNAIGKNITVIVYLYGLIYFGANNFHSIYKQGRKM